jgi:hypothetical protein
VVPEEKFAAVMLAEESPARAKWIARAAPVVVVALRFPARARQKLELRREARVARRKE